MDQGPTGQSVIACQLSVTIEEPLTSALSSNPAGPLGTIILTGSGMSEILLSLL